MFIYRLHTQQHTAAQRERPSASARERQGGESIAPPYPLQRYPLIIEIYEEGVCHGTWVSRIYYIYLLMYINHF